MDKIDLELENCFGINKLKHTFDFTKSNTIVIYASNGVMKTSFANTFQELSKGGMPKDRLFGKIPRADASKYQKKVTNKKIKKNIQVIDFK